MRTGEQHIAGGVTADYSHALHPPMLRTGE